MCWCRHTDSLYRQTVLVAGQADMDSLSAVGHYLVVVANLTGRHARSQVGQCTICRAVHSEMVWNTTRAQVTTHHWIAHPSLQCRSTSHYDGLWRVFRWKTNKQLFVVWRSPPPPPAPLVLQPTPLMTLTLGLHKDVNVLRSHSR